MAMKKIKQRTEVTEEKERNIKPWGVAPDNVEAFVNRHEGWSLDNNEYFFGQQSVNILYCEANLITLAIEKVLLRLSQHPNGHPKIRIEDIKVIERGTWDYAVKITPRNKKLSFENKIILRETEKTIVSLIDSLSDYNSVSKYLLIDLIEIFDSSPDEAWEEWRCSIKFNEGE